MIGIEQVRRWATALPEVEEATHFRLPAFKVRGKVFVVVQNGGTHLIAHVDGAVAKAAASDDPAACEEVWRSGSIFVGVRVDLARLPSERVEQLVELAWRNKAPKRLVASYDAGTA